MIYKKELSIPIAITLFIFPIAFVFRFLDWPFGVSLEFIALIALAILYGIRYGLNPNFIFKDTVKIVMVTSWVLVNIFSILEVYGFEWLSILMLLSGIIFICWELLDIITQKSKENRLNNWQWIGVILFSTKIIFKIMHLPFAGPMFLLGLLGMIMLGIGFINKEKTHRKKK